MIASVETDVFALDLAPAAKLGTKSKIAVEPNYIGIPIYKKGTLHRCKVPLGAENETRTRDPDLLARPSQMAFSPCWEGKWSQKVAPFYDNV